VEVDFDAKKICSYYMNLFWQPEFLLSRFTKQQLEQGSSAIQGPNLDGSVFRIIDDSGLPLSIRGECIACMADLFERLLGKEPFDSSVQMWWDFFRDSWHGGTRHRERGGEDLELQDLCFKTLARVLEIESWFCQAAALPGLGRLPRPHSLERIERYIGEHPSRMQEQKAYALAAARFEVL
jgi:hypothetical protein